MKIVYTQISLLGTLLSAALLASGGTSRGTLAVQIVRNFTGSTLGVNTSATPADGEGTIGPAHFVELINGRFAIYDKTTGALRQSMTDLVFWQNSGITIPSSQDVSDPRMVFDPTSQRWFASAIVFDRNTQASNSFMVAISRSVDPTGTWRGVSLVADKVTGNFADFPTLGLDSDGLYLSANMFGAGGGGSVGSALISIPKADLLRTTPTTTNATSFGMLSYSAYGAILQPVFNPGGSGGAKVVAVASFGTDFAYHSNLVISTISHAAGPGAALLSSPSSISVNPYVVPINPPQPNPAANDLDDGDSRISAIVRQVGNVIYAVHDEEANAVFDGSTWIGHAAVRWYKINATDNSIIQSGTLSDPVMYYFFPSIAANADGTVVIGCNGCSTNTYVSSYAFVGETVGGVLTFGPARLLKAGSASYKYTQASYGASRWGDYSATSVDPVDPTRFWTIQMVPSAPQVYFTQITEVRAVKQPLLTLTQSAPNVTLTWPVTVGSYALQTTTNVGPSLVWGSASATYTTNNGIISATVPASGDQSLFRLSLQ
ncbi:MAG: hypothetical protein NT154_24975 [Verrucomicrobia bacterium]|nr:hypothetical protein [Verrucomicrobiota bacterium]